MGIASVDAGAVVYGSEEFGQEVIETVQRAVYHLPWSAELADQMRGMRERVEASGGERDLKRGFGGIVDVEFLVQLFG